jgi:hypothetical protein
MDLRPNKDGNVEVLQSEVKDESILAKELTQEEWIDLIKSKPYSWLEKCLDNQHDKDNFNDMMINEVNNEINRRHELKKQREREAKERNSIVGKSNPRVVKEPFLQEEPSFVEKYLSWVPFMGKKDELDEEGNEIVKELQEPLLFLMKENGYTEIIEGAKAGEMIIATPRGEKAIMLTPDKITTLKYGGDYYKAWIAYENSATPYPEDPLHTAEMYKKTTQKLAMNWKDVDSDAPLWEAKTKFYLWIIAAIVIALILIFSSPFGNEIIAGIKTWMSGNGAGTVSNGGASNGGTQLG